MASEHMKRFSTSSLIQKMQTKTTVRYHLARTRKARIKKQNKPTPENDACWGGCGHGSLCPAGGDGNGAAPGETVTAPPPEDRRRAATSPRTPGGQVGTQYNGKHVHTGTSARVYSVTHTSPKW